MNLDMQILNWKTFCVNHLGNDDINSALQILNENVMYRSFLVKDVLSDADKHVYFSLSNNQTFKSMLKEDQVPVNLRRYFNNLSCIAEVQSFSPVLHEDKFKNETKSAETKPAKSESNSKFEEGGKFIGLKGAENQKVVVRFPPEASGYLHIGHAKAALINQHYKDHYNGELIMRFDDTNPAKESLEFENVILEDVKRLGVTFDRLTYASDHFDTLIKYCEQLIKSGQAYVDSTDPETMKKERELCQESRCRSQSVIDNERLWMEMMKGSDIGIKCCVRLKLDMTSKNGCMRDPTIYRCKAETHNRTGDKYKVYPTYDFECPIVDSIEGVTHSLRSSEYNDRNEQFFAILDMLGLRKPQISDYSRMSLQNTVLSKRKLAYIVDQGVVDGWDDARMPTVRGILRHGMTVEGLKEFVIAQGFGHANAVMEWDKIWAFNKKVIDPVAPRYTALSAARGDLVIVRVKGQVVVSRGKVARHPKNEAVGTKNIWYTQEVLVERSDVADFLEGSNVTFVNWGNLMIDSVNRDTDGTVTSVDASLNLDNQDFKKTLKVTWLPLTDEAVHTPISVLTFGELITKNVLEKDDDFKNFLSNDSVKEECMIGDAEMARLKKGDIIQVQRKGYYICDEEYREGDYPLVLINIPEGNKKERVTTGMKQKNSLVAEQPKVNKAKEVKKKNEGSKNDITKKEQPKDKEVKKTDALEKNKKISKEKKEKEDKKQTRLCIEAKKTNLADWYSEVLLKCKMIDYYDVGGMYVLRPNAYNIWEKIQSSIDTSIKRKGVSNAYFPLVISEACLMKEKEHIADFSPEVAWVTAAGDKTLEKRVALRPTSETAMYPYFSKWVQSHRDLPLKLNQWCNVVRWELKDPMPFLRSREFLWQEGHSAFATRAEAEAEVYDILDMYADVYEQLLAIPVVKGRKTEREKFAGADFTTTTEVYIGSSGRAIQGATSHHLGQNFSRMFEIKFQAENGQMEYAHQNSWGMTTRTIGILVMVHGDDRGLVLPPRVANVQAVVIPCGMTAADQEAVENACRRVERKLAAVGVQVRADLTSDHNVGWKMNYWEQVGVPMRVEVGPKDVARGEVVLCYRFGGRKETIAESLLDSVPERLEQVQRDMLEAARIDMEAHRIVAHTMADLCAALDKKMLITAPFCGGKACEDAIKKTSARDAVVAEGAPSMGAKSLCIPFQQPDVPLGAHCVNPLCSDKPKYFTMFGRSY